MVYYNCRNCKKWVLGSPLLRFCVAIDEYSFFTVTSFVPALTKTEDRLPSCSASTVSITIVGRLSNERLITAPNTCCVPLADLVCSCTMRSEPEMTVVGRLTNDRLITPARVP